MKDFRGMAVQIQDLRERAPHRTECDVRKLALFAKELVDIKRTYVVSNRAIAEKFRDYGEHIIGRILMVGKRWPNPPNDEVLQKAYRSFYWKNEIKLGLKAGDLRLPDSEIKEKVQLRFKKK